LFSFAPAPICSAFGWHDDNKLDAMVKWSGEDQVKVFG
jgi:hypothetical protein